MTFRYAKWAVVGCALSMSAFAQGQQQKMPQHKMQQGAAMGMPMPTDQQGFVAHLNAANENELELAKIAQEKAQNPQVKQYAQMLVRDHTQLGQQVSQAAKSANIKVGRAEAVNDVDKKMMDAEKTEKEILQGLSGEAFDLAFVNAMVGGHDYVIMLTTAAIPYVEDAKLKQTFTQALPKFEQHRKTAYKLLGQLQPRAQPQVGGAGMGGSGSEGTRSGGTEEIPQPR
ncbi:MAG: DUF4142 domain-containing protein [Myxococcaceae bacterium]